jgi:2,4-dienoyl-CoA reductase-like NADH-dependent reductase (Old Yellow Enzyme family)
MTAIFPHLFSSLRIRQTVFRNRMIVPAMATHFAESDGAAGQSVTDYLEARAAGGFGAIITENIGVDAGGRVMARMLMADDDRFVPGLSRLAERVKRHGAVAIGQINHGGRQTISKITGRQPVAPSPIPCPLMREMPRELDVGEIHDLQDAYASAALRLERAGFDGIEIHAAHGYLAAEFLSRYSNHRTDEFGGDLTNRLRFLSGIIERVRAATNPKFLVFVRISVEEFVPNGLDTNESILIGQRLAAQGIDALSLSVGVYESYNRLTMLSGEPEGPWLPLAKRVKQAISIPVVGVGRIKRAQMAEDAVANADVDLVAFGRASITDPDFPKRIRSPRARTISGCTSCNLCLGRSAKPQMVCPVNPFVGREALLPNTASVSPKKIVIHGGGIAALTAAWLAALRGHDVELVEKASDFAGMQGWRSRVPGQAEYADAVQAVTDRAMAAGVVLSKVSRESGEASVLWTVRRYEPTRRSGLNGITSKSSFDALRDADIDLPDRVLVVGDDLSAADAALLLAASGRTVTLRSPAKDIGFDAHPGFRSLNRKLLSEYGATIEVNVPLDQLESAGGFDAVVYGRTPEVAGDRAENWALPYGAAGTLLIDDAYEPGALVSGVYRTVDEVLAFDA